MKPIINPWLIYLIDLVDKFQVIINIALVVLGFTIICLGIAWLLFSMEYGKDDSIIVTCKKYLKKSIIWVVVSGLLFAVVPSKDTMYVMLTLDNVTTDNIQAIGKTGKDVVDYITDQIDKIVNKDDEKENK
nr:MAG TPA: Renin receptor-like protein [Caudoviricetes sp.]